MPRCEHQVVPGCLIIVCGLAGAGKTTLAQQLEVERDALRLCPDEWMEQLAIDIFDQDARGRIEQLQWQLAQRSLQLGSTVVIEWGTWARSERNELRLTARQLGATVELRYLAATADELWDRVQRRDRERHVGSRALTRDDIDQYIEWFEPPDETELALFD